MSANAIDFYALNQYAALNPQDAAAIDAAYTAAQNALRAHGRYCSNGSKASDILVAGLMRYVIESSKVRG